MIHAPLGPCVNCSFTALTLVKYHSWLCAFRWSMCMPWYSCTWADEVLQILIAVGGQVNRTEVGSPTMCSWTSFSHHPYSPLFSFVMLKWAPAVSRPAPVTFKRLALLQDLVTGWLGLSQNEGRNWGSRRSLIMFRAWFRIYPQVLSKDSNAATKKTALLIFVQTRS